MQKTRHQTIAIGYGSREFGCVSVGFSCENTMPNLGFLGTLVANNQKRRVEPIAEVEVEVVVEPVTEVVVEPAVEPVVEVEVVVEPVVEVTPEPSLE